MQQPTQIYSSPIRHSCHMIQKGQWEGWLKSYLFLSNWEKVHVYESGCFGLNSAGASTTWMEHLYCSKNQQWNPCCHIWFNFTSSHTNSFSRRGVVTTGIRTAATAVTDLKKKWAIAGGWAAETHFGRDIKVCVSHTMPLPAVRFLWASSNQLQAVRHIHMSSWNKRWEIT